MVQKLFGPCEAKNGTQIEELLYAGASGRKRVRQNVLLKGIQVLEDGRIPAKEARKNYKERVSEAFE